MCFEVDLYFTGWNKTLSRSPCSGLCLFPRSTYVSVHSRVSLNLDHRPVCASPTSRVLVVITNVSNSFVRGSVHLPICFLIHHPVSRVIRYLFNGYFLLSMLPDPQGRGDCFASPDLSSARGMEQEVEFRKSSLAGLHLCGRL